MERMKSTFTALAGSPYPRNTSCRKVGTTQSVFMRARMVCSTALKLFSLGLRRTTRLMAGYTSLPPLPSLFSVMSSWYWLGSSHTRNTRLWPLRGTSFRSSMTSPSSSSTSMISHPRTYLTPWRTGKDAMEGVVPLSLGPGPGLSSAAASAGQSTATRNRMSCRRRRSHSSRMLPRNMPRLTVTSAMTSLGRMPPTSDFSTVVISMPRQMVAMRAHPSKSVVPSKLRTGRTRVTTSWMSSRIS
mmetsp:Transcript_26057/g.65485  ORF Transcript_26057/g.65485 Transcript_26057/m.65485 type:complete len:243 (-) Transcript_26057:595-1323(-)